MDIDSQIADTLGLLDRFQSTADVDNRIRALSAKLRYLELRRYHEGLAATAEDNQEAMKGHLNDIAYALKTLLANQAEPRDHTVVETRALGVKLRLVGKHGDPLLEEVTRVLMPAMERLAEAQRQRVQEDGEQETLDREADRKLRLERGNDPDAPDHD